MKKKIAVITFLHEVALQHKAQIEFLLGDMVGISVYAFDSNPIPTAAFAKQWKA